MTNDGGETNLVDRVGRMISIAEHVNNDTDIHNHVSNITLRSTPPPPPPLCSPDVTMQLLTLNKDGDDAVLSIQKEAADAEVLIANQELEYTKVELQRAVMDSHKKDRQLIMFKRCLKGAEDQICDLRLEIDLAEAEKTMLRNYLTEEKKNMMEQRHLDYKYYKYSQALNDNVPKIQSPLPDNVQRVEKVSVTKLEPKRNKLWKKVKGQASYTRCDDKNLNLEKFKDGTTQGLVDGTQCDDRQDFSSSTRSRMMSCSNSCSRLFLHPSGRDRVTNPSSIATKATQRIAFARRSSRCKDIRYQMVQDVSEDSKHVHLVQTSESDRREN